MYNKVLCKIKTLCRDIFINLIAASVLTPHTIRWIIYKLSGIRSESRNLSPGIFLEEIRL